MPIFKVKKKADTVFVLLMEKPKPIPNCSRMM